MIKVEGNKKRKHELNMAQEKAKMEHAKLQKIKTQRQLQADMQAKKTKDTIKLAQAKSLIASNERNKANKKRDGRMMAHGHGGGGLGGGLGGEVLGGGGLGALPHGGMLGGGGMMPFGMMQRPLGGSNGIMDQLYQQQFNQPPQQQQAMMSMMQQQQQMQQAHASMQLINPEGQGGGASAMEESEEDSQAATVVLNSFLQLLSSPSVLAPRTRPPIVLLS